MPRLSRDPDQTARESQGSARARLRGPARAELWTGAESARVEGVVGVARFVAPQPAAVPPGNLDAFAQAERARGRRHRELPTGAPKPGVGTSDAAVGERRASRFDRDGLPREDDAAARSFGQARFDVARREEKVPRREVRFALRLLRLPRLAGVGERAEDRRRADLRRFQGRLQVRLRERAAPPQVAPRLDLHEDPDAADLGRGQEARLRRQDAHAALRLHGRPGAGHHGDRHRPREQERRQRSDLQSGWPLGADHRRPATRAPEELHRLPRPRHGRREEGRGYPRALPRRRDARAAEPQHARRQDEDGLALRLLAQPQREDPALAGSADAAVPDERVDGDGLHALLRGRGSSRVPVRHANGLDAFGFGSSQRRGDRRAARLHDLPREGESG